MKSEIEVTVGSKDGHIGHADVKEDMTIEYPLDSYFVWCQAFCCRYRWWALCFSRSCCCCRLILRLNIHKSVVPSLNITEAPIMNTADVRNIYICCWCHVKHTMSCYHLVILCWNHVYESKNVDMSFFRPYLSQSMKVQFDDDDND